MNAGVDAAGWTSTGSRAARYAATRTRVLDAAVECILEEGFYRASSNRIVERAGVSWGVIQHHFGTREKLLLAVLTRSENGLLQTLDDYVVEGETVAERLDSFVIMVFNFYRRRDWLASMQILLNLQRDPATAAETAAGLDLKSQSVPKRLAEIFTEVGGGDAHLEAIGSVIFEIVRGVGIGLAVEDELGVSNPRAGSPTAVGLLSKALAAVIE